MSYITSIRFIHDARGIPLQVGDIVKLIPIEYADVDFQDYSTCFSGRFMHCYGFVYQIESTKADARNQLPSEIPHDTQIYTSKETTVNVVFFGGNHYTDFEQVKKAVSDIMTVSMDPAFIANNISNKFGTGSDYGYCWELEVIMHYHMLLQGDCEYYTPPAFMEKC